MKRFTVWFIVSLLTGLALLSCDGLDENYSSNPNLRLSFSVDTLSFDTVFTQIGSATKQFMIYNTNSEPLLIEEIMLAGSNETGFRMNVDGRKGDLFQNVRIPGRDSLYVFVEITVNPRDDNQPLLINDSIIFRTNTNRQAVILEAYGQNVYLYKNGRIISENSYLDALKPYLIYDSLVIDSDVTVEIEPGAVFYMHNKANVVNHGTLIAEGTSDKPIIFRGDRLDFILNDVLPYDRTPSPWGGIFFCPESFNNRFEHVIVRNGTTGITCELSEPETSKLIMRNSQITNMGQNLFTALNCSIDASNTEFTNAGGGLMILLGGEYQFTHCTVANFMTLEKRQTQTLTMANHFNSAVYPLNTKFDNCIIDGSLDAGIEALKGELNFSVVSGGAFDYRFNHCLIKSLGQSSEEFNNVIFTSVSPSYRLRGGERNKYRFDFRPDSATTLGVGQADPVIAATFPTDRFGVSRLENNGHTLGAYEHTPSTNP